MDAYIGQIFLFAGNFAPRGWMFCQGQLLPINQNQALFAILGTTYGGDGRTNFALPDLRGRTPVSSGQGQNLGNYQLGMATGSENVTLNVSQLPMHNHLMFASSVATNPTSSPANAYPGLAQDSATGSEYMVYDNTPNTTMNVGAIKPAGGNQPHDNMAPFLALNYIICIYGIFPSRN